MLRLPGWAQYNAAKQSFMMASEMQIAARISTLGCPQNLEEEEEAPSSLFFPSLSFFLELRAMTTSSLLLSVFAPVGRLLPLCPSVRLPFLVAAAAATSCAKLDAKLSGRTEFFFGHSNCRSLALVEMPLSLFLPMDSS